MSTYSPNLRVELITTGDQAGTWGTTTNTTLGTLLEAAISGYVSVSITSANQALSAFNGAPDESRNLTLALTTTTTAPFNVYAPPAEKTYIIYNASAYDATIYNSTILGNTTAAGIGVVIPAGKTTSVWTDGTNFASQIDYLGSLSLATDLAVVDGGTGASTAAGARANLGLGTIATQNASTVNITGGVITGITDLAVADGGTGASDATTARTNLGLGTIATQSSSNVAITGGSITGITDLAIADGGTGASSAAGARTNLGGTTVGSNLFTLPDPNAIRFIQLNANNTVTVLDAAGFRSAIGAGSATGGSVTSVDVSGGTTGLTTSGGPVTTTGTITIAGTLNLANGGTGSTTATGARTNLGLGSLATLSAINNSNWSGTALAVANGGTGGVTAADARTNLGLGSLATLSSINNSNWSGTALTVSNGGTGATSLTSGALLLGGGTGNITTLSGVSIGQVPQWNGTAWTTASLPGGSVTNVTASAPLASSGGTTPNISLTGTVGATNGGTAQTTWAAGDLLYASGIDTLAKRTIGSTGQVLTVSGGLPTWAAPAGDVTGAASSVDNGVALFSGTGGKTLKSSAAQDGYIYGVRIGRGAGAVASNTALGTTALAANTTGANNTAVGVDAMTTVQTGARNVAVGHSALKAGLNCTDNVAVGYFAMSTVAGASGSVAVGTGAMQTIAGARNVAIGNNALKGSVSGSSGADNVAVGYRAGIDVSSGISNVFVGSYAGNLATIGSANTFVGYEAGLLLESGGNNTCIGNQAATSTITVSNEITLGNASVAALRCQVTTITSLSDVRDKSNIQDLPVGLNFISALRPVEFDWNMRDGAKVGEHDTGFIAQDLQAAQDQTGYTLPGLVYASNPDKLEAGYGKLLPVMVKAIQELKAELDAAKAEIQALKGL